MIKFFYSLVLIILLSGCSFIHWPWASSSKFLQKQTSLEEKFSKKPNIQKIQLPNGDYVNVYIGDQIDYSSTRTLDQTNPKPSIIDKIKNLGIVGIILVVLSIFFPPLAAFLGAVLNGLTSGTKRIVSGIDKALDTIEDPEVKRKFLDTLSKEYDSTTKLMVAKMKHK